jgi:hypothetical protein
MQCSSICAIAPAVRKTLVAVAGCTIEFSVLQGTGKLLFRRSRVKGDESNRLGGF